MNPFTGMSFGLMFIAAIFAYGYSKGHRSYKPVVTLIETQVQHVTCRATLGYVIELPQGVVVCAKIKAK